MQFHRHCVWGLQMNFPEVTAGGRLFISATTCGGVWFKVIPFLSTITILGCGSASGVAVPPYFVFPGVRMRSELLEGATPGANGDVSESGWKYHWKDNFRETSY